MPAVRSGLATIALVVAGAVVPPASAATDAASGTRGKASTKTAAAARKAAERPSAKTPPSASVDPRDAQQQQSAERDRLTARIAEIKTQIAAGERSRSGAAASLARAEKSLATVNRHLDELSRRQREALDQAATIDRQRNGAEGQIVSRQRAYESSARLLYEATDRDTLRTLLTGGDAGDALQRQGDLGYYAVAQSRELTSLKTRVDDLEAQRRRADETSRTLATQAQTELVTRETLAADQATQRQTLAQLSKQIAAQRDTAAALEADEKRLARVVQQLQKVIERQAAEERARREAALRRETAARRAAEQANAKKTSPGRAVREPVRPVDEAPLAVEPADASTASGVFAQLQGRLRLPVRGTVTGRFGSPRGTGGGTWKGVFVRTDGGAEVHAVAAGRVVFADELRGFGNLLIVDHGDQYLSIYGNNDTLLKKSGDAVKPGEVVARAGNTIGDDQTGLYFELRFRGRPFDPLTWTGSR